MEKASQCHPLLRTLSCYMFLVFFTFSVWESKLMISLQISEPGLWFDHDWEPRWINSFEKKVFLQDHMCCTWLLLSVCGKEFFTGPVFWRKESTRDSSLHLSITMLFLVPPNANFLIWVSQTVPVFLMLRGVLSKEGSPLSDWCSSLAFLVMMAVVSWLGGGLGLECDNEPWVSREACWLTPVVWALGSQR